MVMVKDKGERSGNEPRRDTQNYLNPSKIQKQLLRMYECHVILSRNHTHLPDQLLPLSLPLLDAVDLCVQTARYSRYLDYEWHGHNESLLSSSRPSQMTGAVASELFLASQPHPLITSHPVTGMPIWCTP